MGLEALFYKIREIGKELARCDSDCKGIFKDPENGVLPRGPILEGKEKGELSCIIVGLNPGCCKEKRELKGDPTYDRFLKLWEDHIKGIPYYRRARDLAKDIGYTGAILWTDLCKCENKEKAKGVPIETLAYCFRKYLIREVEVAEEFAGEVPIIALGRVVFSSLCFAFPDRFIIGVPHPTGVYNRFKEVKAKKLKRIIEEAKREKKNIIEYFPKKRK